MSMKDAIELLNTAARNANNAARGIVDEAKAKAALDAAKAARDTANGFDVAAITAKAETDEAKAEAEALAGAVKRALDAAERAEAKAAEFAAKAEAKAAEAKAKANKAEAAKAGRVLQSVSKQAAANIEAAANKVRRVSRIRPLADMVFDILAKGPHHVAVMAEMCQCSERDIRLAIDKLRAGNGGKANLVRLERKAGTFGWRKGFRPKRV